MLDRLNEVRRAAGLPELTLNRQLTDAAGRHVNDLAGGRVDLSHSHTGSDGSTPVSRAMNAGYPLAWVEEMTGWGFGSDDGRMLEYWLNSPVHHDIIYRGDLTEVGIVEQYRPGSVWGSYWVVLMGRPTGAPKPSYSVYVPVAAAQGAATVDLLPYMQGDGRMYEVRHPSGATETFQSQTDGAEWYQVKNSQWAQFYRDGDHIWRGMDTSPGNGRFYVQFEPGLKRARWCPRNMTVGQTWTGPGHRVQFYDKATCAKSAENSGAATNRLTLVARHAERSFGGITVADVVELTDGNETFWFGRGFGLVAWSSPWGRSEIVAVYAQGERPSLVREKVNCF